MNIYVKVNGIEGDVVQKGLEKCIEVASAQFNVKRRVSTQVGSPVDREGAKPTLSELMVMKEIDKTSPYFFEAACTGKIFPSVEIRFMRSSKESQLHHLVTLTNVLISGYEFSHEKSVDPEDHAQNASVIAKPREQISFNFTKIEVKHVPYGKDNEGSSPISSGYDLETAKKM